MCQAAYVELEGQIRCLHGENIRGGPNRIKKKINDCCLRWFGHAHRKLETAYYKVSKCNNFKNPRDGGEK